MYVDFLKSVRVAQHVTVFHSISICASFQTLYGNIGEMSGIWKWSETKAVEFKMHIDTSKCKVTCKVILKWTKLWATSKSSYNALLHQKDKNIKMCISFHFHICLKCTFWMAEDQSPPRPLWALIHNLKLLPLCKHFPG